MIQHLTDKRQNSWHLTCIQLAGINSFPIFATSVLLMQKYHFTSAFASLLLGNFIVIFIRYFMIIIGQGERLSTLDVAKRYLGKSYWVVAFVLLFATIAWYVTQNTYASNSIYSLLPIGVKGRVSEAIQIIVFLGILSTLLCMNGIVPIRRCATYSFPVLFILVLLIAYYAPTPYLNFTFENFSLGGIPYVVATNLGVAADIPTFFRHSSSKRSSIKALFFISFFSIVLSIIGLFLYDAIQPWFGINTNVINTNVSLCFKWTLLIYIFISAINANITNIYSASVAWEVIAPKLARKEWLILSLGLTTLSVLIIDVFSISWLLDFADSGLVSLSLIFILAYLTKRYIRAKYTPYSKFTFSFAWLGGFFLMALHAFAILFLDFSSLLVTGIGLSASLIVTASASLLYKKLKKPLKS